MNVADGEIGNRAAVESAEEIARKSSLRCDDIDIPHYEPYFVPE